MIVSPLQTTEPDLLAPRPAYTRLQCLAPLEKLPQGSLMERLRQLEQLLHCLLRNCSGGGTLKCFMAPALYFAEETRLWSAARFLHFLLAARELFAKPCFQDFLLVPGSFFYHGKQGLLHAALAFLGGTRIHCQVLQQNFPQRRLGPQSQNAVFRAPSSYRAYHPSARTDDFHPETGLRLGIELGRDHRDGLLWSSFNDQPNAQLDLQLVPDLENNLVDEQRRILGNTCAVRPGGLLFGTGLGTGPLHSERPPCRLFVHQGGGLFAPIPPDSLLTPAGPIARYPSLPLRRVPRPQ